ncbi:hypothetical protein HK405_001949 [Cladochytrium tenue]|nr:hypothetical protein HK405_001949 [Cladochytrium tenue]
MDTPNRRPRQGKKGIPATIKALSESAADIRSFLLLLDAVSSRFCTRSPAAAAAAAAAAADDDADLADVCNHAGAFYQKADKRLWDAKDALARAQRLPRPLRLPPSAPIAFHNHHRQQQEGGDVRSAVAAEMGWSVATLKTIADRVQTKLDELVPRHDTVARPVTALERLTGLVDAMDELREDSCALHARLSAAQEAFAGARVFVSLASPPPLLTPPSPMPPLLPLLPPPRPMSPEVFSPLTPIDLLGPCSSDDDEPGPSPSSTPAGDQQDEEVNADADSDRDAYWYIRKPEGGCSYLDDMESGSESDDEDDSDVYWGATDTEDESDGNDADGNDADGPYDSENNQNIQDSTKRSQERHDDREDGSIHHPKYFRLSRSTVYAEYLEEAEGYHDITPEQPISGPSLVRGLDPQGRTAFAWFRQWDRMLEFKGVLHLGTRQPQSENPYPIDASADLNTSRQRIKGMRFQFKPGDVLFLRSQAVEHFLSMVEGRRYCIVFETHQKLFDLYKASKKGGPRTYFEMRNHFDKIKKAKKDAAGDTVMATKTSKRTTRKQATPTTVQWANKRRRTK